MDVSAQPARQVARALRRVGTDGDTPAEVDAATAGVRSLSLDVNMDPALVESAPSAQGQAKHQCPVAGCCYAAGGRHPGWTTFQSARAHIDAHLLGLLPGLPPDAWMSQNNWTRCSVCTKLVSKRCNGGIHHNCMAERLSGFSAGQSCSGLLGPGDVDAATLAELPSLTEICQAPVATREFLSADILPKAVCQLQACLARVLQYNAPDAWEHVGLQSDTLQHQRSRLAWTELLMFPKTCLQVLPGGQAKDKRNRNILTNRLDRWAAGERRTLWDEAMSKIQRRTTHTKPLSAEQVERKKHEEAVSLARRGLPGKAVQRLTSEGLAPNTPEVQSIMRSKFVAPPVGQESTSRAPAPTANELTQESIADALKSFDRGAAPGPSGLRADFLRQAVGEQADKPIIALITSLCNILANGEAPRGLQSILGGARGTAFNKTSKTGEVDARPVCSGEVWRRLVGKALLRTEMEALRAHLLPLQLAVGAPSGGEVMPHLARQWRRAFEHDSSRVLLAYDQSNAHNTVDRHAFLTRMREVAPGLSRWLEYIYPTSTPTHVFYQDVVIESRAGGQQGCPLIGACHAVVMRMVFESLGLMQLQPGTTTSMPALAPAAQLDMAPAFSDDGLLAGSADEVLRVLRHMKSVLPSVGLQFSSLAVTTAAGCRHAVDLTIFEQEGCTISLDGNAEILKSPVGTDAFCKEFCSKRAGKAAEVAKAIASLSDAQVGYYLLRWSCNAGRMNYLARTTPAGVCRDAMLSFDAAVRRSLDQLLGIGLSSRQWSQATLPVKMGGLGLRSAASSADAAYVASRAATHQMCSAIRADHAWDTQGGADLASATGRLSASGVIRTSWADPAGITQNKLNKALAEHHAANWRAEGEVDDAVRLNAASGTGSGKLLGATPSKTLDKHLTNAQFGTYVLMRLGVDVSEAGHPCNFCGQPLDCKGRHPLSCMAGGDATVCHNLVRNEFHDWCRRGGLRPELERGLAQAGAPHTDRTRPADVLVCYAGGLAARLPDGARAYSPQPVALDFAVINALGRGHWDLTRGRPCAAASAYSAGKCSSNGTAARCEAAGVRFQPMVVECQGGWAPEALPVIEGIAAAVARQEGRDKDACRLELLQRVDLILARCAAQAVQRRNAGATRAAARAAAGRRVEAYAALDDCPG